MKESKKTTSGIDVKRNESATLYHTIRGFINTNKGEAEPNDYFKLRFDNVYENMEISGGKKSYEASNSPIMEAKPQKKNNNQKLTKWKQCVSYLVQIKKVQFPFQATDGWGKRRQGQISSHHEIYYGYIDMHRRWHPRKTTTH